MSLSTTTTTTYELAKYSRAYSHSTNTASTQPELEWQHFANPVIHLTLDTKKSPEGRLESYRLRIIWTFGAGGNSMDMDQRDVTFEDLDLVAYSTIQSFQAPQGMPIKAVYQAAVVGLRYQHPRVTGPGQPPQYRRFQVTFQTEAAAAAFVDSIRFIIPCKANAGPPARIPRPVQAQTQSQSRPPASQSQSTAHISMPAPRIPVLRPTASTITTDEATSPLATLSRTNTTLPPFSSFNGIPAWTPSSRDFNVALHSRAGDPGIPEASIDPNSSRPSSAVAVSSAVAQHSSSDPSAVSSSVSEISEPLPQSAFARSETSSRPRVSAYGSSSDVETSLPSSSLPASSPPVSSRPLPDSPVLMPPPPVPPQASLPRSSQLSQTPTSSALSRTTDVTLSDTNIPADPPASAPSANTGHELKRDIAATLRDSAGLYELPREDLEKLVAEIVREEGFAELMSALHRMWKIKGLVGIQTDGTACG